MQLVDLGKLTLGERNFTEKHINRTGVCLGSSGHKLCYVIVV